jgi:hypothetical protein
MAHQHIPFAWGYSFPEGASILRGTGTSGFFTSVPPSENSQRYLCSTPARKFKDKRLRDRLLHVAFAKSAGWTEGSELYPKANSGACGARSYPV